MHLGMCVFGFGVGGGRSCDNKYIYFEEGGGTWKSIISKDNNYSYSECVGCGLNMLPLFRTVHLGLQNVQYL